MSNQSGISVSSALEKEFPEFVSSSDFAAILAINHAKEHVELESRVSGDLGEVRSKLGEGKEARYLVLRSSKLNDEGSASSFAFVQFMPDLAPLSSKMKYASSHATIHRQLGGSSTFVTTIFWTDLGEVSEQGVKAHQAHEDAPAPLTDEEKSLATAQSFEASQGSRGKSVAGQSTLAINANVSAQARSALSTSSRPRDTAVVLKVSSDSSESLDVVGQFPVSDISEELASLESPRYVVADLGGKVIFAFVCPRTASIKQRMLFASTRISFLEYLKTISSVDALIETHDPKTDLTLEKLKSEFEQEEPSTDATSSGLGSSRPKFQRPKPPKRR